MRREEFFLPLRPASERRLTPEIRGFPSAGRAEGVKKKVFGFHCKAERVSYLCTRFWGEAYQNKLSRSGWGDKNKKKKLPRALRRRFFCLPLQPLPRGREDTGKRLSLVTDDRSVGSSLSEWEDRKRGHRTTVPGRVQRIGGRCQTKSTVFIIIN